VILIGHSYGGEVVANYLTSYSSHVEKAVFISPGSINPKDISDGFLTSRLSTKEKVTLFKKLLYPRVLMAYGLLQVNPQAAISYAADKEMDHQFDIVYSYTQPAIHSRNKPIGPKLSGLGFYAHQAPQSKVASPKADIRNELSKNNTEALIIKGSSDYLSWSSAMDYKSALHNSRLIYLSDAGHNLYQDKAEDVLNLLKAFLNGDSLPVDTYEKVEPPADYEGAF
jgi:proline iminopeptidase